MATGGLGEHGNVTGADPLFSQGAVVVNTNTSMLATVNVRSPLLFYQTRMLIPASGRLEHDLTLLDRSLCAVNSHSYRRTRLVWRRVPTERGLQRGG